MTSRSAIGNVARGAVVIAVGLGLTTLLGWWLDQPTLRNGFGVGVAMNPATAAAFVFAGASLWSLSAASPGPWLRRFGWAGAVGVMLIAVLKLGELLFGWPLAVDQLLFPSRLALPGHGLPNRMAPNTAFVFLMMGIALLLVRTPSDAWRLVGRSLALLGGVGGALTLLGYAYGRMVLTGVPGAIPMAVNTALGFVALAAGITTVAGAGKEALPGEDFSRALRRRVNLTLAVAVGILVLTSAIAIWGASRSRDAVDHRRNSILRRAQLTSIRESVQDAEIGERGYLLTGTPEFLEPYQRALEVLPLQLGGAEGPVRGDTVLARQLDALRPLVQDELSLLTQVIELHVSGRPDAAAAIVTSGRGKLKMDQVRAAIAVMVSQEDSLMARWDARRRTTDRIALFTNFIAGFLAVFFLILAGRMLNADLRKRAAAEASLRESELILSSVGEGVHGIDLLGRITFENPAAARMLGWSTEALIGKPAHATMHHHHTDGTEYPPGDCPIYATLRDGQPRQVKDEVFWRQDGTSFPVDYTTAPLRDRAGRLYGSTVIFRDTTERKRLAEERDRFFAISLDMLCIANADGHFKRLSPAFTDTLGWTVQELIDRPFLDFVHPDDQAATLRAVEQQTIAGEPVLRFENRYRHKDGSWRVLSWRSVPQPGGFMFATARDVTDAHEAEAALRSAKEGAEAANRAKSDFLAKMSHELRTPLNSIIGFSEILEDGTIGSLTDKQRRYVTNVLSSGRNLLELINDILDLSKVEAGRMELNPAELDLGVALEEVRGLVSALADKKRLTIEVGVPPAGLRLRADPVRFRQIMFNLVGNAIKFTPDGGRVDITARFLPGSRDDASRGWLEVAITDTGVGIAPEHLELIFHEFEQVDSGRGQTQPGTGLGLALTRKLVQLHGGRTWAESEPGRGSTFRFTLPAEIEWSLPGPRQSEPAPPAPAGPLILVVDDEAHARDLMAHYLTGAGYRVVSTGLGEEAIALARELLPDGITLDILMPGRDGIQTLAALKSHPDTSAIPIVVVSVTDRHELGRSLGVTDWLVKPVQRSALVAVLARTIGTASRGVPRTVLIVDDEPAAVEYLAELLGQQGFGVISASGGRLGIELALARRPDLVILDLMMPEVNGFDVVRTLRSHPDTGDIPILVLTAKELDQQEMGQLRESVQGIVRKGGRNQLLDELHRVCPPALAARP